MALSRLAAIGRLAPIFHKITVSSTQRAPLIVARSFNTSLRLWSDPIAVRMPALSPTMTEGTILKWHKEEGDSLAEGDIICDIQTDKTVVGFEIGEEGILAKILVPPDSGLLPLGTLLALIVEEGEDWKNVTVPEDAAAAAVGVATTAAEQTASADKPSEHDHPLHSYGPAVRSIIDLYDIHPSDVKGTGPHSQLLKGDLLKYIKEKNLASKPPPKVPTPAARPGAAAVTPQAPPPSTLAPPPAAAAAPPKPVTPPTPPPVESEDYVDFPLTSMRKVIAKRLTESKTTIPHSYATVDCNMEKLLKIRKGFTSEGVKVSVNDFIIKAAAVALQRVPQVNAVWSGDCPRAVSEIDVCVAVATDNGLITPIVKDAVGLGVEEISSTVRELAGRAREGKLQPHEFQGGSFTISNLGMFGITEFSAVINPPQACIMAIGSSRLVLDEEGQPQTRMMCTLSSDARIVDDDLAGRFLEVYKQIMENPMLMLTQGPQVDLEKLFANAE